MTHTTSHPIHKFRIIRMWEHTPVLLLLRLRLLLLRHWYTLIKLLLLLLLAPPFFLLPSLPLRTVV